MILVQSGHCEGIKSECAYILGDVTVQSTGVQALFLYILSFCLESVDVVNSAFTVAFTSVLGATNTHYVCLS